MDTSTAMVGPEPWWRRFSGAIFASLFLIAFYWRGLDCWFYQDDFGWLHLGPAKNIPDFFHILFAPKAHGNLRPWSENLFFYGLKALFGVNPLPFRILVLLTAVGNVLLLDALARKLTRSRLAALGITLCWIATPAVSGALCWTCIYNQTQCVFFLLLALYLFVTGRYRAQFIAFVLGLGSLELMVVYPALASLYTLIWDRANFRRTLPLYAVSLAFIFLHFSVAPAPKTGPYAIQVDARIVTTLASYTEMAVGPERLAHFQWDWPKWFQPAGTAVMAVLIVLCLATSWRTGLFGLGWYLALLAPIVVLPDHIMDYLLVGPAVGMAFILAGPLSARRRWAGALAVVCYLSVCLPASWKVMTWNLERSHISRDLVLGVVNYNRHNPGKTLLLTGMDTDQFVAGFADLPFEVHGMFNVFLLQGAEKNIHDGGNLAPLYVMPDAKARPLLAQGQAVVLDVTGGNVREITPPEPATTSPGPAAAPGTPPTPPDKD
jgi:hypothetical protein